MTRLTASCCVHSADEMRFLPPVCARVPDNQVITTQRAADILGMSRPFFIKLLETGAMAHHRVGNQRRVYLREVLQFAQKREHERQAALNRLSRHAFETGLYEKNKFPEGGQDE